MIQEAYWLPDPWGPTHEGHVRLLYYVDHRLRGEIEQHFQGGPVIAKAELSKDMLIPSLSVAQAWVETRTLRIVASQAHPQPEPESWLWRTIRRLCRRTAKANASS